MATSLRLLSRALLCCIPLALGLGCSGDPPPTIVAISITPTQAAVVAGKTIEFTATITGTTNIGVTWSVQEGGGGTVSGAGIYTAPAKTGTYHVVATSDADPTRNAIAAVAVTPATPPAVGITISPTAAAVIVNGTQAFTATVTNSTNTSVFWSVQESGGGVIAGNGTYTAPATPGTYHVIATAAADTTKTAVAPVTVTLTPPPVSISISPTSAAVATGGTQTFTATVTGSANTAVTWSITEASGGTITNAGLYTAPGAAGTYHVVAKSAADTSKTATAAVTVSATAVVAVTLAPTAASLQTGGTQTFTATVTGSANNAVTWSITEASGGSITTGGVYTAPGAVGTYHVVATSVADNTKSATAAVIVSSSGAASLAYTDPSSGTFQLKRNAGLSTATHLVLDLVGSGAPSGTAVALTLTADAAFASWSKVAGGDPEFVENGAVLTLGSGVQALKGKVAAGTLSAVVGQKGTGSPVSLNGAIARVALDLKGGAVKGAVALSSPKAQVLAGGVISAMTITIGTLAAQ